MFLLRIFLPSWKFFDRGDFFIQIFFRTSEGAWQACSLNLERRWWQFLWNPLGNLQLYYQSKAEILLSHLLQPQFQGRPEDFIEFHELKAWVHSLAQNPSNFQFKIVRHWPKQNRSEDLVISAWYGENHA